MFPRELKQMISIRNSFSIGIEFVYRECTLPPTNMATDRDPVTSKII